MKKLIYLLLLLAVYLFSAVQGSKNISLDIKKYDNIFNQISEKRVGPDDKILSKVATPFIDNSLLKVIRDRNATKKKRIILKLYGIFDKKAKINKKWYKIYSKVYGYKLVKIKDSSVILRNKKKKLELFLRKKNDKIQITKNF